MRMLVEKDPTNMGDVYQMMTYIVVILISAVIMTVWLKRRGRRKKK
jgi:antibiotic biosynthesis monooxygenase (ABM) superfamily enzyme